MVFPTLAHTVPTRRARTLAIGQSPVNDRTSRAALNFGAALVRGFEAASGAPARAHGTGRVGRLGLRTLDAVIGLCDARPFC